METDSTPDASYGPTHAPPPSYLAWAILSTVLFCLPLGVVAIVFSAQVNGKYVAGDYAGAQAASDKARSFSLWSTLAGLVLWLVVIVLVAAGLLAGVSTSTSY